MLCVGRVHRPISCTSWVVEEEADESLFWLEMVVETELMPTARVQDLIQEADELTAIFVASRKTAKTKR